MRYAQIHNLAALWLFSAEAGQSPLGVAAIFSFF